ncbi:MAG: 1-deoxy-D-xylulose-5-phosphate reductoisomerase [Lachnospiraceae bacterium]|nr:1-deoxy-D-xylulose-5-phosphate reductoisomerase [Lachnospiraceae bacterium]
MRKLCLLGSTGSIGTQTIDVANRLGGFEVYSLAARSSVDRLEEQTRALRPKRVCVFDEEKAEEFRKRTADLAVDVVTGMEGLIDLASDPANDLTVTALVGMIGIRPTIAAIEAGCDVALANKETLVTAGHIIMPLLAKKGVRLLPIDSEHSAIFQCLQGNCGPDGHYPFPDECGIEKILLTASGGPFRGMSYDELTTKTAADALKHPNWLMGPKITVDSASMVNKALEVMEARWLFNVAPDDIEVVIQPKSIIHSAVQFKDGAILAQMGLPDMRLPIQYALYYPKRLAGPEARLNLFELARIEFEKPDYSTFKGLKLGLDAIRLGGSICTVFNAANEYAVARFLKAEIGFTGIYDIIEHCMNGHENIAEPGLDDILRTEAETYKKASELFSKN